VSDNDTISAKNLNDNPILKEIGIEFISDDGMFDQELIYTKPVIGSEGESPTIRIPINGSKEVQAAIQTIKSIISTYGPILNEDAMRKYGMDSAPSGGSSPARKAPR
jgi:hypothetical protein